LFGALP
ncbi:hypothetical protein TrLO_g7710, partial [Triparma laevis f. longispina]